MTLAYATRLDMWHLSHGARSKLNPLICRRPQRKPIVTAETINKALESIK